MNIFALRRYSTLQDDEPSLNFSFCSVSPKDRTGRPIYSSDYEADEDVLLRRLTAGDYLIEREIHATHPRVDLWREYFIFDIQTASLMPEEFSQHVTWHSIVTICDHTKVECQAMLALPKNLATLRWQEISIRGNSEGAIHENNFLGVNEDLEGVTYLIQTPPVSDLPILRLSNDPRRLTFISDEFLRWIFTLVPSKGFFTVAKPIVR